jgi:FkbM family methyltransferase
MLAGLGPVYTLAATAETLVRYFANRPIEPDHHLWERLDSRVTFVDVGANRGQTALSFASADPQPHRIVSFEANPANERYLKLVSRILGGRFEYHLCGLGDTPDHRDFYVPVVRGRRLTGEGSFDPDNIGRASSRFGGEYVVMVDRLPIRRLDSFGLDPDVVKVDVQGLELQVVQGMGRMLEQQPLLLVEANPHTDEALRSYLAPYGYERFRRDAGANRLRPPADGDTPLNWFYAAPATRARFGCLFA